MKLTNIVKLDENGQIIKEMARPAKPCPKCGKTITGNHYWYKGGWKCKGGAGAATAAGTTPTASPAAAPAAATPAAKTAAKTPAKKAKTMATAPASGAGIISNAPVKGAGPVQTTKAGLDWLKEYNKCSKQPTYSVRPDEVIDVDGSVDLREMGIQKLPVRFGKVTGNFFCASDDLTTCDGMPEEVGKDCLLDYNELASFVGVPHRVGQTFTCNGNPVTTLEGLPEFVGLHMYMNELPNIKSLQGFHKIVKNIGTSNDGMFECLNTPIESSVLGLLLVRNLSKVSLDNKQVTEILNKHLAGERDIHICQDELIDAGLAAFAKL